VPAAATAKRVLIADPSEAARRSLARFLRDRGIEVLEASDGSRALSEALLRRPDVLVLDLGVAVLDAERLVQILRTNPRTSGIPIFFVGEQERSVSGFRRGVDEYFRRPYREEEVLLRIERVLGRGGAAEVLTGDSEISGSVAQIPVPDLWQMLALNRKSGIIQVESAGTSGAIYVDRGEILSAVAKGTVGEKALYRLVPLREGRFRFIPGRVDVRRTIRVPAQHAILEALRQHDELRRLAGVLPSPLDAVSVTDKASALSGVGGVVREVLLLAECCRRVEEVVDNCGYPDLVVYRTLLHLKERGAIRIGAGEVRPAGGGFLRPEDLARLKARLDERAGADGGPGRLAMFLPDAELLETVVVALGRYREFEVDRTLFSLRRREGVPLGLFGRIVAGGRPVLALYTFPYRRASSPLWYALAPRPVGIVAFLKDEVSSSLEGLLAVSEYTRGAQVRVVLAVMGKSFTNFGLGENTLRLFQGRLERLGCSVMVRQMERLAPEEIRDALGEAVRQFLEGENG